ncbi:MAG: aspartate/glutamate racemase family protein [Betaproteobacteria bacterium]
MHKVLVVVPFPVSEEQLALRRAQMEAVRLGPDIEFDFRPVKAAPSNYVSHHDYILADAGIMEAGLRSMLDIPVIGPGRAPMLMALMLGERFSVLAMWQRWKPLYTRPLSELGHARRRGGG